MDFPVKSFPRLLAAALLLGPAGEAGAVVGLSSQFVNVALEGLEPGGSYNLLALRGLPYTVTNRGDASAQVKLEVRPPEKNEFIEPYEPIPDPSWVTLTPDELQLRPSESGYSAITVNIPNDAGLKNRHFQAVIFGHTLTTGWFAAGVKSNLRFSIGPSPETVAEKLRQDAMVLLNYDMWPSALYISSARVGRYDAKKEEGRSFKITNRAEEPLEFVLSPARWTGSKLPPGYAGIEDLSWVEFEPARVKLEGESLKTVQVKMDIPEKYRCQKLAFMMKIALPVGTIVNLTNRILVSVQCDQPAPATAPQAPAPETAPTPPPEPLPVKK